MAVLWLRLEPSGIGRDLLDASASSQVRYPMPRWATPAPPFVAAPGRGCGVTRRHRGLRAAPASRSASVAARPEERPVDQQSAGAAEPMPTGANRRGAEADPGP